MALLIEMLADDRALRGGPARELVSALVRFGTAGTCPAPAGALAAAEGEVAARVTGCFSRSGRCPPSRSWPSAWPPPCWWPRRSRCCSSELRGYWARYQGPYGPELLPLLFLGKLRTLGRTSAR